MDHLGEVAVWFSLFLDRGLTFPTWGKVRLGSVHDKIYPSMSYPKWGRLSISYPRWGKVRLGLVLGQESCPEGQFLNKY